MTAAAIFAALFYLAAAVLVAALGVRVYPYARTPAPPKIPTTPAPPTRTGAALRVGREGVLFERLFQARPLPPLLGGAAGFLFHRVTAIESWISN